VTSGDDFQQKISEKSAAENAIHPDISREELEKTTPVAC
jgi:hypothetical protein